jgi:hypothetical protein
VIREHLGLKWTEITPRVEVGQDDSGTIFEQQVRLDTGICVRRITIQLKQPTRHGDLQVTVLTNLPDPEVRAAEFLRDCASHDISFDSNRDRDR